MAKSSDIEQYAANCPSGFGDGSRLLRLGEVRLALEAVPEWPSALSEVRAAVRQAMAALDRYLEGIPHDWYPDGFRRFGRQVIEHRLSLT